MMSGESGKVGRSAKTGEKKWEQGEFKGKM